MTTPEQALAYLRIVDDASKAGQEHRRQAIRDAHSAGAAITEIAAALGIKNRQSIYEILNTAAPTDLAGCAPTPVVYLRGAGADAGTWAAVVAAMNARGWWVVRDRTQAWHLARGRVPVVMVDISNDDCSTAGRVRARYDVDQKPELPLVGGRTILDVLDPELLALAVIDQLQERALPAPTPAVQMAPGEGIDAFDDAEIRSRSVLIPDGVWNRAKAAVSAGQVESLQTLIAQALVEKLAGIELVHNGGRPYQPVDRLHLGQRATRKRAEGTGRQIRLPEPLWGRARAVIAAGHAPALPQLLAQALDEKVASIEAGTEGPEELSADRRRRQPPAAGVGAMHQVANAGR